MTIVDELRPHTRLRVYDLVQEAGVDVSAWAEMKGGAKKAASNPKYCYEWAFVQPGKVVVLNFWHDTLEMRDGRIVKDLNMRARAQKRRSEGISVWVGRAERMDTALRTALQDHLPVRVIVLDREMPDGIDGEDTASQASGRLLDPEPWAVTAYNWDTGACTVTRGEVPQQFIDQFEYMEPETRDVERRPVTGETFKRDPAVRRRALQRAQGLCELCGAPGFETQDGRSYIETHHITPLSDGGPDSDENVVALCPNHHREAHFGASSDDMKDELKKRLAEVLPALPAASRTSP